MPRAGAGGPWGLPSPPRSPSGAEAGAAGTLGVGLAGALEIGLYRLVLLGRALELLLALPRPLELGLAMVQLLALGRALVLLLLT